MLRQLKQQRRQQYYKNVIKAVNKQTNNSTCTLSFLVRISSIRRRCLSSNLSEILNISPLVARGLRKRHIKYSEIGYYS